MAAIFCKLHTTFLENNAEKNEEIIQNTFKVYWNKIF